MTMRDQIQRMMAPLHDRVMLAIGRAVINAVNDGGGLQRLQVTLLEDEVRDDVERVQQYGLSAAPLPGADAVVVCIGGSRDHPIVIAVDDRRHRPVLGAGEVALYSNLAGAAGGHQITLKADQSIEVTAKTVTIKAVETLRVEAPLLEVTGEIRDNCDGGGLTMRAMREAYNAHGHAEAPSPPSPQQVA
ncbi:MAG TPA: phage baseplate assembly protein V [Roseomonas sp.]|jgi:phage baseplate assembly protein V